MVDILLEYGYYIIGIGAAIFATVVSYFSIKKHFHDIRIEQQNAIDFKIRNSTTEIISAIKENKEIVNQKLSGMDRALNDTSGDIKDIQEDVKILEKDFKSICEKIGKHDYIVDKILPEYIDLRDSLYAFKGKIDENLIANKEQITRNTEKDTGEEGER